MRNISSFLILVTILFFVKANSFIFCQEPAPDNSYKLSLGISSGTVYGKSLELVYPVDTKADYLSELIWEMNSIFYFDLNIDFGKRDFMSSTGFFSSISFKLGIPGNSGIHQNRDWMSAENDNLTHFSSHKNTLRDFYWADVVIGLSIPVKPYFYFIPAIKGSWMRFSFSGIDGQGKYARYAGCTPNCPPPWESSFHPANCGFTSFSSYSSIDYYPYIYQFHGEVIRYKQNWLLAAVGITTGITALNPLAFELSFYISPFTYCAAVDEHIGRNIIFNDYSSWAIYMEPGGRISYATERVDYSFEFSYNFIGRTRGPSYANEGAGFFKSLNEAGAGLSIFDISFSITLKF
ncbi:MAG: omptin family outer membrane protease [Treponema sp.]|nr:omptin family outer membrane protease [Treponema sp.]